MVWKISDRVEFYHKCICHNLAGWMLLATTNYRLDDMFKTNNSQPIKELKKDAYSSMQIQFAYPTKTLIPHICAFIFSTHNAYHSCFWDCVLYVWHKD